MLVVSPKVLVVNEVATITVTGSSHGGETITVHIDDGEGQTETVSISLDSSGKGSAEWEVPDWALAKFNYSSCEEVARNIEPAESSESQQYAPKATRR